MTLGTFLKCLVSPLIICEILFLFSYLFYLISEPIARERARAANWKSGPILRHEAHICCLIREISQYNQLGISTYIK